MKRELLKETNNKQISMTISKISFKDIEEIIQIAKQNNLSYWSIESYRVEILKKNVINLCIRNNKQLVGFLISRLIIFNSANDSFNDSFNDLDKQSNEAEMLNLAILKSMQNSGFGQMLLDNALKVMQQNRVREIWLEVRKSNKKAVAFYTKNGFSIQNERKNYYVEPIENALVMNKLI